MTRLNGTLCIYKWIYIVSRQIKMYEFDTQRWQMLLYGFYKSGSTNVDDNTGNLGLFD